MDLVGPIRSYIENTFSPEEATSSEEDLTRLGLLRSEIVVDQQTHEQRRETLLAYYRALCVVESRFPISKQSGHIDVAFSWADAFKTNKRVSIANVHFEKAAVVFNLGASWSQLGLAADRATPDGIKTAAHAFQQAAGAFTMLRDDVLGKVLQLVRERGVHRIYVCGKHNKPVGVVTLTDILARMAQAADPLTHEIMERFA